MCMRTLLPVPACCLRNGSVHVKSQIYRSILRLQATCHAHCAKQPTEADNYLGTSVSNRMGCLLRSRLGSINEDELTPIEQCQTKSLYHTWDLKVDTTLSLFQKQSTFRIQRAFLHHSIPRHTQFLHTDRSPSADFSHPTGPSRAISLSLGNPACFSTMRAS
jgi:hypothetical protein